MLRSLYWASAGLAMIAAGPAFADDLAATGGWSANTKGQAATPPMGWNSWNAFHGDIDEEKVLASANVIVNSGLAAKGFKSINIDDGWWLKRDMATGRVIIRTKTFPSAAMPDGSTSFRPLTDRLHAMGLRAGIYSDIGRNTCGQVFGNGSSTNPEGSVSEREVGLYGHVDQDIGIFFKEWGFDYIKVDGCGIRALPASSPLVKNGTYRAFPPLIDFDSIQRTDVKAVRGLFEEVAQALDRHNPDGQYTFSLCIWGSADVRSWAAKVGNLSRTSEDITPQWSRMLHNMDTAARRELYAHPGSWNDPDMLFIGSGEFDAAHMTEARSHFSMWAMLNAPLIIGFDLRKANAEQLAVLGNSAIIALNQDPGGHQAVLAYDSNDLQIYVKTLANGDKAVALLNRTSAPIEADLTAAQLKLASDAQIGMTDLWSGKTMQFVGETKLPVGPRETLVYRVSGRHLLPNGSYLSELPGNVYPAVDGVTAPQLDPMIHRGLGPWTGTRGGGEPPRYAGWGGARADRAPWGQELSISGTKFPYGIGIMANSRIEVRNPGKRKLVAQVGIDDSGDAGGRRVRFEIYGDRKLLSQSAWQAAGTAPASIEASVAGYRIIELVARTDRPGGGDFPVSWGNAALTD